MNTVRKLRAVHMHLVRNGYSEAADVLWLILTVCKRNTVIGWLNAGSFEPVLKQILFSFDQDFANKIVLGFLSLKKLLAVLPKEIK